MTSLSAMCSWPQAIPLWDTLLVSNDCVILPSEDGTIRPALPHTAGTGTVLLQWSTIQQSRMLRDNFQRVILAAFVPLYWAHLL